MKNQLRGDILYLALLAAAGCTQRPIVSSPFYQGPESQLGSRVESPPVVDPNGQLKLESQSIYPPFHDKAIKGLQDIEQILNMPIMKFYCQIESGLMWVNASVVRNPKRLYRFMYTADGGRFTARYDCRYNNGRFSKYARSIIFDIKGDPGLRITIVGKDGAEDLSKGLEITITGYESGEEREKQPREDPFRKRQPDIRKYLNIDEVVRNGRNLFLNPKTQNQVNVSRKHMLPYRRGA